MVKLAQTLKRRSNPAMHYIPCCGGEADVLMRHNVERMTRAGLRTTKLSSYNERY